MNLRAAVAGDVPAVLALERQVFGRDAWSEESVLEELTGSRRAAVVACDQDGLVGYVVVMSTGGVSDLQRIVVEPRCRGRGLAHDLLAAVASGERMLLEVSTANAAARAFYATEGFTEIHRRASYYRDGSDAVVMERPART